AVSNPRELPQGAEYQVATKAHGKDPECQSEIRAFEMIRQECAKPCAALLSCNRKNLLLCRRD
ncbi:MAG: hypothetical protein MUO24_03245, partial [Desulfobacterales bacterium]|nr:hypothetical protein [Desulfobacterales bacterium]